MCSATQGGGWAGASGSPAALRCAQSMPCQPAEGNKVTAHTAGNREFGATPPPRGGARSQRCARLQLQRVWANRWLRRAAGRRNLAVAKSGIAGVWLAQHPSKASSAGGHNYSHKQHRHLPTHCTPHTLVASAVALNARALPVALVEAELRGSSAVVEGVGIVCGACAVGIRKSADLG